MKTTDLIGFSFTVIFLLITYFIIRNITFPKLWIKIVVSVFVPLFLLIGAVAIINIGHCPLYFSGVAGLCWIGLTVEMFVCTHKKKSKT